MYQSNRLHVAVGRLLATLAAVAFWLTLLVSPGATERAIESDPSAPQTIDAHLTESVGNGQRATAGSGAPLSPQGPTRLVSDPSDGLPSALSPVEYELLRLTNQLRADPAGPLRRLGQPPACLDDPYFNIEVDPLTGYPVPVPALTLDIEVSVSVARDWALRMYLDSSFEHRPSSAQQQIYAGLDIMALAWGENIAWASGYGTDDVALVHFKGLRESDIGHYCSLLTARFSRIGVGEVRVDGQSWAVQNFYYAATRPEPVLSE